MSNAGPIDCTLVRQVLPEQAMIDLSKQMVHVLPVAPADPAQHVRTGSNAPHSPLPQLSLVGSRMTLAQQIAPDGPRAQCLEPSLYKNAASGDHPLFSWPSSRSTAEPLQPPRARRRTLEPLLRRLP